LRTDRPVARGCGHPTPATRIEIHGTPGALVSGYYVKDGHKLPLHAKLPTTLPSRGVSQFAVRKSNPQDDLIVNVQGPNGFMSTESPPGKAPGYHIQLAGGFRASILQPQENEEMNTNSIMVITPYWYDGTWVFDDPRVGLAREPFVSGVPDVINRLVRDIPDARRGFRLTFSAKPFPGYQMKLTWLRGESGGNWYRLTDPPMEGWLCPAMFHYFDAGPKDLFVRADAKAG
jgi:hypothetical protein